MATLDIGLGALIVATAFGAALMTQWLLDRQRSARRVSWTPLETMGEPCVFLFEDDRLVDATAQARTLLGSAPPDLGDWQRLCAVLGPRFPELEGALSTLGLKQRVVLRAADPDDPTEFEAEWRGGLTRIVVSGPDREGTGAAPDGFGVRMLTDELETLREAVNAGPVLIWKVGAEGRVLWANGAYLDLARRLSTAPAGEGWPLPAIFPAHNPGVGAGDWPQRVSAVPQDTGTELWFDCVEERVGQDILVYAVPAERLVRAEISLREFVQALTKTFAHLTTGLAVFDRERRLTLFNPALTELSSLEPQFLSSRPTLYEFLDKLRDRQRMPEPKDYKTWRRRIGELEAAATTGTHIETWSLPNGQTYRVTGRPHPDGAVAFLIEDISAEISTTRRFRSDLELGQSVFDHLDTAIAVFSASGGLVLSNAAYDSLWNCDSGATLSEISAGGSIDLWEGLCEPTPVWNELRERLLYKGERDPWSARVKHRDGRRIALRLAPVASQAKMVQFEVSAPPPRRARVRSRPEANRVEAD